MLSFLHRWGHCWKCEFDLDFKFITMVESNYFFYKKVHIKIQSNKENVLAIFVLLQEKKNSNLFEKKCTQENVKCHIQHEGSCFGWIAIEQVN